MNDAPVVGIDLGGTASRFVVIRGGELLSSVTISTPRQLGEGVRIVADGVRSALAAASVDVSELGGIGIGASGPVDVDGVIRNPETLPGLSDLPLTALLGAEFSTPCVIDNDAVTAALAESRTPAAQGRAGLLMVTLGTGVGVAVIRRGTPFRGADGVHPEGGHVSVPGPPAPCYCGRATCLEQTASRTALQAAAKAATGDDSVAELARAAESGDPAARRVFSDFGARLGDGLLELCTQHRPELVVLGGSASPHLERFRVSLEDRLATLVDAPVPEVRGSDLADLSGAVGATYLIGMDA